MMRISKTVTHTVAFTVQAFWNEEGGMGHASYGKSFDDLAQAIHALELANEKDPTIDWVIVCDVDTAVSSGKGAAA